MNLTSALALLVAAASLTAHASADFTVKPERVTAASASSKHVKFVKQWTLSAGTINSLDLSLAGVVHVSHVSGLPAGVIGHVNVSSDSRAVLNAVTVSKDVDDYDTDLFDLDDNDDGGELNVWMNNKVSTGYLLTEIFLAATESVTDVKSQQSAKVVINDGVLKTTGRKTELQIEATGSSSVYVFAVQNAVNVRQLNLESTGSAEIEFNAASVKTSELQIDTQGASSVTVLTPSISTSELNLEATNTGSICIDATTVKSTWRDIQGKSQISMPNSVKRHGTTGTFDCDIAKLPKRDGGLIAAPVGMPNTLFGDNDDLDDDRNDDVNDANDDLNDSTDN